MGHQSYPYQHHSHTLQYTFTSIGKTRIEKVVIFDPTPVKNIYNLGFGDLMANGKVDDTANSNNGDIVKVLSTVIQILTEFTKEHPHAKVGFIGSSSNRTALYRRIMKTYYQSFTNEFIISALLTKSNEFDEVEFKPNSTEEYSAFFIRRIN
jgi:hypothetical protein